LIYALTGAPQGRDSKSIKTKLIVSVCGLLVYNKRLWLIEALEAVPMFATP
jgi:hypothetical protein